MNNTELAILSLLAEKPCHGYELEQLIAQRNMRDWTELAFSTIYYILKQLEKKAWVRARSGGEASPRARNIYELTPEGREAWNVAALDSIAYPRTGSDPVQLGLSVLPLLDPADVAHALGLRRARLTNSLNTLYERMAAQPDMPLHVHTMFDLSITLLEAEIDWLSRQLQDVQPFASPDNESPPVQNP
jgi:hypothetical protein